MPLTLKGIKSAIARKFRRTKKPTPAHQPNTQLMNHSNAEALKQQRILDHEAYQKLFNEEGKIRTSAHIESMNRLLEELNMKQQGCERDLSIAVKENENKQTEINELKSTIINYESIAARDNKLNRELQDELAQCPDRKSRKLVSSGRRNTVPTSTVTPPNSTVTPPNSTVTPPTSTGTRRSGGSRSRKSTPTIVHTPLSDIQNLTGQEMYDEYLKLTDPKYKKTITPYQHNYIKVINEQIEKIVDRGVKNPEEVKLALLKVLDRWQGYNPFTKGTETTITKNKTLLNNRPPEYITYHSTLFDAKNKHALNVNNGFGYGGYGF